MWEFRPLQCADFLGLESMALEECRKEFFVGGGGEGTGNQTPDLTLAMQALHH